MGVVPHFWKQQGDFGTAACYSGALHPPCTLLAALLLRAGLMQRPGCTCLSWGCSKRLATAFERVWPQFPSSTRMPEVHLMQKTDIQKQICFMPVLLGTIAGG